MRTHRNYDTVRRPLMTAVASTARWLAYAAALLIAAVLPQTAGAVASTKQVTAILQGTSQKGWVTDAQLKAEYDKWKAYPNVTAAVRSTSSNKDDAKLLAWESSGMKYFYTAIDSDYRFAGSMYAPAASPDAVMAKPNNLGLYYTQLLTQLTADSGWNWQQGIGKANWAQLDSWATQAKARGKKIVWNEPSHAWDEVKKNATAMSYFNKWKDTVVITYGTNFPDQVNAWAKPGAVSLSTAIGAPLGISVQSFNFTDASQTVTRAGVKALGQAGVDAGATYVEVSGDQANNQPTSQFILGAEDLLSAAAIPVATLPKATAPKNGAYTATLIGTSQLKRAGTSTPWTSEKDLRDEYNLWNTKPNVKPTFRGMAYSKNDSIMAGWQADGFKYFWTAGSSDYRNENGNFYVSQADGDEVLRRSNSVGLYLHELASQYTKEGFDSCAAVNGGGNCKWDWATGIQKIDWGRIDHWVSIAREEGKKIIWAEPSHGFVAILNDASARSWFARWGDTVVPTWSTNFSNECRISDPAGQGSKCQVSQWSRPGAKELGAQFSGAVGDSLQSWFFRDQVVSSADPRAKDALTSANALALANDGKANGATYFQVEGYGEGNDMNVGSSPSWYMTGIRQFLDSLATTTPPALTAINAQRVPLYAWMNFAIGDQKLTRANYNDVNYTPEGIAGYVFDRQAPGSVPLYQLWSDISKDYMYTADFNEVTFNESSWLQYKNRTVIGYVMAEKYADTLPLYPLWNSNESMNDHRYTMSPGIRDLFTRQQEFGYYQLQDVSAYLFDNDGRQITTPLTYMWSDQYTDSFYARDEDIPWYSQNGWSAQMRVGAIYTEPVNGAVPVYEAWSDVSTDHLYTTDPLELYRNMSSWYAYKNVRVIGYAPRGATSAAQWPMHQYWNSGTSQYPGWANHHYSPAQGSWAGYEYQGIAFWVVPVDTTAPPKVLGIDAGYDPEAQNTTVTWIPTQDDGFAYYRYSYSINGGAYSSWINTDINEFTITGAPVGVHVGVKAVAVDASGNASSETYQDVVVQIPTGSLDSPGTDYAETPDADVTITPQPSTMINDSGQAFTDKAVAARAATTPRFDNMCPGDATTCGTFNGAAAGRYALKYYRKARANTAQFSNWEKEGGDCTNFVSQALWAGGKKFIGTDGYFTNPDGNDGRAAKMFGVKNAWWSNYRDEGRYRYYTVANAWYRVKALRVHLEELNLATRITSTTSLKRGDVVFINSDGNSLDGATHVEVVSQLTPKYGPWLASHSKYYNMPLSKLRTRLTNLYGAKGANDGWNWWVYRPTAAAADLPS